MIPVATLLAARERVLADDLLGARALLVKASRTIRSGSKKKAHLDPLIAETAGKLQALIDSEMPTVKGGAMSLTDKAKAILLAALLAAQQAGWDDSGASAAWDEVAARQYATERSDWVSHLIMGLAAGLLTGAVSAAMGDARMRLTADGIVNGYERGFHSGVASQGTITRSTWEAFAGACELCADRDGESWDGDPPFWPGDGGFGDICFGSVNCRCSVSYDVVPISEATGD